jgi:hypothetical protein
MLDLEDAAAAAGFLPESRRALAAQVFGDDAVPPTVFILRHLWAGWRRW